MSIPVIYRDTEKSIHFSTDDYTTLSDYHHSFHSATKTSQLRLAIAPGSEKRWNKSFQRDTLKDTRDFKQIPINNFKRDNFDYSSYSKQN